MASNNRGQALVEFVIILPIILILIFGVIDFGRVISLKGDLENVTSDVVTFYQNGKTPEEISSIVNFDRKDEVNVSIIVRDDYTNVKVSMRIEPITPGLSMIAGKVFDVSSSRVIRND